MFVSHRPICGLSSTFPTPYTAYDKMTDGLSLSEEDAVFRLNAADWFFATLIESELCWWRRTNMNTDYPFFQKAYGSRDWNRFARFPFSPVLKIDYASKALPISRTPAADAYLPANRSLLWRR
jgi:hypothetical protein